MTFKFKSIVPIYVDTDSIKIQNSFKYDVESLKKEITKIYPLDNISYVTEEATNMLIVKVHVDRPEEYTERIYNIFRAVLYELFYQEHKAYWAGKANMPITPVAQNMTQTNQPEIPLDPEMMREVILKVQLPIEAINIPINKVPALFYNEDRTISFAAPLTKELSERVSFRAKSFWVAWIYSVNDLPLDDENCIREVWLEKEAPYQDW